MNICAKARQPRRHRERRARELDSARARSTTSGPATSTTPRPHPFSASVRFRLFLGALAGILPACASAPRAAKGATDAATDRYVFSYFKGNGEDGLHLAYSEDGLR